MIAAFTDAPEYEERFAGKTSSEIITSIYQSLFGRQPDPEGLAYYTEALESGGLSIETIAISILDGAQNDDAQIIENKLEAANKFTASLDTAEEIAAYSGDNAEAYGQQFLSKITADPDSVPTDEEIEQAIDEVEALPPTGGPSEPGEGEQPAPQPTPPSSGGGSGSGSGNSRDTTPPDAPTNVKIVEGGAAIEGKAEAGSTVKITIDDKTPLTVIADGNGNFRADIDLAPDDYEISVTATDRAGNESKATEIYPTVSLVTLYHGEDSEAGYDSLNKAVDAAVEGDAVYLAADVTIESRLNIDEAISINGNGHSIATNTGDVYAFRISAGASLSDFDVNASGTSAFILKIAPDKNAAEALSGVTLSEIDINNATKTAIDFNGVTNSSIGDVSVAGTTNGNGITLSDSENITLTNVTTSDNAWGGVGIYAKGEPFNFFEGTLGNIIFENYASEGDDEPVGIYAEEYGEQSIDGISINGWETAYVVTQVNSGDTGRMFSFFFDNEDEALTYMAVRSDDHSEPPVTLSIQSDSFSAGPDTGDIRFFLGSTEDDTVTAGSDSVIALGQIFQPGSDDKYVSASPKDLRDGNAFVLKQLSDAGSNTERFDGISDENYGSDDVTVDLQGLSGTLEIHGFTLGNSIQADSLIFSQGEEDVFGMLETIELSKNETDYKGVFQNTDRDVYTFTLGFDTDDADGADLYIQLVDIIGSSSRSMQTLVNSFGEGDNEPGEGGTRTGGYGHLDGIEELAGYIDDLNDDGDYILAKLFDAAVGIEFSASDSGVDKLFAFVGSNFHYDVQ
ncbi:Ig-like domain-containing protein [Devosia pacifica]|nr:Ig-like domain-containing protein [Devosia pacifica]